MSRRYHRVTFDEVVNADSNTEYTSADHDNLRLADFVPSETPGRYHLSVSDPKLGFVDCTKNPILPGELPAYLTRLKFPYLDTSWFASVKP